MSRPRTPRTRKKPVEAAGQGKPETMDLLLGWKADQAGKLIIAAMVALVVAVLFSWLVTGLNIPWIAPVSHDSPTLLPVRAIAALIWAAGAYAVRRAMGR